MASSERSASAGLTKAARIAVVALLGELVILAVTGALLFFLYRPSAAQAWDDISGTAGDGDGLTIAGLARDTHRVASFLALWTAVAAGLLVALEPTRRARRVRSALLGFAMFVVVLLASTTGYLLPWDQLALWAVTVGTDMKGYTPLMGDDVRFVLLGGKEIATGTLLRWLFVHMLPLGAGAVALTCMAWARLRSRSTEDLADRT